MGIPQDMAYCQPSGPLRDRLLTDLDIRGLNACPDKVDISAIRLVYDFADHSIENLRTVQPALNYDISFGVLNPFYVYLCNTIPGVLNAAGISREKLLYLYIAVHIDAAGRAALAVQPDEVRIHVRFLDIIAGILVEIGTAAWTITASPLVAWAGIAGTHVVSLGAAASVYPAPNLFSLVLNCPLELRHTAGGFLLVEIETTNAMGFPVNSTATVNAIYSFK